MAEAPLATFLDSHRIVSTGDLVVLWCANPNGHQEPDDDGNRCGWDRGPTAYPKEALSDDTFENDAEQEARVVQIVWGEASEMRAARSRVPGTVERVTVTLGAVEV